MSEGGSVILRLDGDGGSRRELTDDDLRELYAPASREVPRLRANFVASVDGSATASGLSGALGGPADHRVFAVLRELCDVIVVASGTVRAEGYAGPLVEGDAAGRRVAQGLPAHPAIAVVSGTLSMDPGSEFFATAPVRPLVLTCDAAPFDRREALAEVADVVSCGTDTVEPRRLVSELLARGLAQMHCEGGPSLLGSLIEADVLDALALTVSPSLEGGLGGRITRRDGSPIDLRALELDHVLASGSMLLTHWTRRR
ncbi:pyrimidine reductase family protein [Frondihabitans australicus]|uniref:Riboflavin biosynthesis pyrimidine reductase n=1 Tax=Frondihabitans australicus TaxID=386892 RepID=A0A495IJT3_9MICO|nr:pyrimidine reductase family protein [Frondihabitans australicus]RKR76234.1 riboflavin biosynthesis pyrimidine reductase [Frondihabitans australicus]